MRRGGARRPALALGLGLGLALGLAAGGGALAADYDYDYDYDYEDACESVKPGAQMRARCDSVGGCLCSKPLAGARATPCGKCVADPNYQEPSAWPEPAAQPGPAAQPEPVAWSEPVPEPAAVVPLEPTSQPEPPAGLGGVPASAGEPQVTSASEPQGGGWMRPAPEPKLPDSGDGCLGDLVPTACGPQPGCELSCETLGRHRKQCTRQCASGCFCPVTKVRLSAGSSACVDPSACPATTARSVFNSVWQRVDRFTNEIQENSVPGRRPESGIAWGDPDRLEFTARDRVRGVASAFDAALGPFAGEEVSRALDGQAAAPGDPMWVAALGNSVRAADTLAGWDALARDAVLLPEGAAPPQCTASSVARPLRACLGAGGGALDQLDDLTGCCYALNRAFAPGPSPQADCLCNEAVLSALNGLMRTQAPAAGNAPVNDLVGLCSTDMPWFSASYFRQPGGQCGGWATGMADFGEEAPRAGPLLRPMFPSPVDKVVTEEETSTPHESHQALVQRVCEGVSGGKKKRARCHRIEGCVCEMRKGLCGRCMAESFFTGEPAAVIPATDSEPTLVYAADVREPAAAPAGLVPLSELPQRPEGPGGEAEETPPEPKRNFWETVGLAKEITTVTGQVANPYVPLVADALPEGAKDRLGSFANAVLGKNQHQNSSDVHSNSTLNQLASVTATSIGRLANNDLIRSFITSRLPAAPVAPAAPYVAPSERDMSLNSIESQLAESHQTWVDQVGSGARVLDGPSEVRLGDYFCGPMPEAASTLERAYREGEYAKVFVVEGATPGADVALLASTAGGSHTARFDVGPQSHCIGVDLGLAPARSKSGAPVLFRQSRATGKRKPANFYRQVAKADSEGTAVFELDPSNQLWSPFTDAFICRTFWFQAVDLSACEATEALDLAAGRG